MSARSLRWFLGVAFAIAVGHLIWTTVLGPPRQPKYLVGGKGFPAFQSGDPSAKKLFLRRRFFLSKRPRHAWIQVLGRDRLRLVVNGRTVDKVNRDGFPVAVIDDIVPFLNVGPNVIAIEAEQGSVERAPVISIDGAYVLDDGEHPIELDKLWRCNTVFDRDEGGLDSWWFGPRFNESKWPFPKMTTLSFRAKVSIPPRAVTSPRQGHWITTSVVGGGKNAGIRREFDVAGRPKEAWLRLTSFTSFLLAVNGVVIDEKEEHLGTPEIEKPVQRTYDISPVVQQGHNSIALLLSTPGGPPHVLADVEVEDEGGNKYRFGSDDRWSGRPGVPPDWSATAATAAEWSACQVETGDLDILPWMPIRQTETIELPLALRMWWLVEEIGIIAGVILIVIIASYAAQNLLRLLSGTNSWVSSSAAVSVAFILPTTAIALGILATYDPRIANSDVFRPLWVAVAAIAVVGQWILLGLIASAGRLFPGNFLTATRRIKWQNGLAALLLLGLMVDGFWLRYRRIATEPLNPDEVTVYLGTLGFLQRGFPSYVISDDLPPKDVSTSELIFGGTALASLVFDNDCYVVRFPCVVFGVLTILLLFLVGRNLFGLSAGLFAAAIYTFSPSCIQAANFGRYFSQLQFFALLTFYLFWLIIKDSGPINVKALWWTAIIFCATFLSWEGSALMALGMIVAALLERRGRLRTIICSPSIYLAMLTVGVVVLFQYSHRVLEQTRFLVYGTGVSDLTLTPMWRYPRFQIWYYVWEASWTPDSFLPMVGLAAGAVLSIQHRFRHVIRALLLVFFCNAWIMSLVLPVKAPRYSYHLTPFMILIGAAAVQAGLDHLVALVRRDWKLKWAPLYVRGVVAMAAVPVIVVASGITIELPDLKYWRVSGYDLDGLKFPDLAGPVQYLRQHSREGDVILTSTPHVVNHLLDNTSVTDFWPETRLHLQATLGDSRDVPLHRIWGAQMVSSNQGIQQVFGRGNRIWYLVIPSMNVKINEEEVSTFIRMNMDVVYEDFATILFFRDNNHRGAVYELQDAKKLKQSHMNPLP